MQSRCCIGMGTRLTGVSGPKVTRPTTNDATEATVSVRLWVMSTSRQDPGGLREGCPADCERAPQTHPRMGRGRPQAGRTPPRPEIRDRHRITSPADLVGGRQTGSGKSTRLT